MTQAGNEARPQILNLDELEEQARKRLDPASYDFMAGGAGAERTLKANREAFEKITITPRVLTGIKQADTSTTLLGQHLSTPIYVTPMSNQGVAHPSAEVGTAQGSAKAGSLFVTPTGSNKTLEEIATTMGNSPYWFQLYLNKDPEVSKDLLHRAEKAGYSACGLTVDLPVLGVRERDIRNQFTLPQQLKRANVPTAQSMAAFRNLQSRIRGERRPELGRLRMDPETHFSTSPGQRNPLTRRW